MSDGYIKYDDLLAPLWESQQAEYRKTHKCVSLDDIVARVRNETAWLPFETLTQWMERTGKLAIAEWEASKPPLPLVQAQQAKSAKLLAAQLKKGPITPEQGDEQDE